MNGGRAAAGIGVFVVVVVLGVFGSRAREYYRPPHQPPWPPAADQAALLALARAAVTGSDAPAGSPVRVAGVEAVIVTMHRGTHPSSGWADLRGRAVEDAIREAVSRRSPAWDPASTPFVIRIDLVGPPRRIFGTDPTDLDALLDPGIDGLLAEGKPGASGPVWIAPAERVLTGEKMKALLTRLSRSAGALDDKGAADPRKLRGLARFRAASFVEREPGGAAVPVVRGNVLPPYPPTAADLREAAVAGGRYLAAKNDENGRFVYELDASDGRHKGGYNLLRHCGTAMSLFQAYGISREDALAAAGRRALGYVVANHLLLDPAHPDALFLREANSQGAGELKLGALGLGVLAHLAAVEAGLTLTHEEAARTRALGNGILAMQMPSGELRSYHRTAKDPGSDRRSIYYPGEATLALVRLHRWDPKDPRWLEAAKRSADFQIGARWTWGGLEVHVPPDAWGAQALEELYAETKEERYRAYAFKIGDELLSTTFPRGANVPPDLAGAAFTYERAARVTPTSSRNEAVVAVARLARDTRDETRARKYRQAAIDAAWFSIAQQYREANLWTAGDANGARGGIRESVIDPSIRIDGVQHALTAFLGLADMLEPLPAEEPEPLPEPEPSPSPGPPLPQEAP